MSKKYYCRICGKEITEEQWENCEECCEECFEQMDYEFEEG